MKPKLIELRLLEGPPIENWFPERMWCYVDVLPEGCTPEMVASLRTMGRGDLVVWARVWKLDFTSVLMKANMLRREHGDAQIWPRKERRK